MRFKHLGATMLAGALALSMVLAPTTHALAYTADHAGTQGTYRNGDNSLISQNENVIYQFTKAQIQKMQAENTAEYQKIYNEYGDPFDWDTTYIEGVKYWIKTETVYENTLNGKTSNVKEDVTDGDISSIPKTIVINAKSWYNLYLEFAGGNVGISSLKSSRSKVAAATIAGEEKHITSANETIYRDSKAGKWYYVGADDERVYVDSKNTVVNASYGYVTIRINAKKKGTSKLTFDTVDYQGKKKGKKTITIKVKDTTPFKELTYAGKNLISDPTIGKEDKNYIYYGRNVDKDASLGYYTTKKKGNLVVKMNSDYKLVKIEVGKLFQEKYDKYSRNNNKSTYKAGKKEYLQYTDEDQFNEESGLISDGHILDLNGDGDCLDIVNGVKEWDVEWKYKTVKNKSKITLSTVKRDSKSSTKTYNSIISQTKTDADGNAVLDENGNVVKEYRNLDANDYTSFYSSTKGMYAPTNIKITYYDKVEKAYKVYEQAIMLKTGK